VNRHQEVSSKTCTCKHNHVFRGDQERNRIPEATLKCLRRGKETKGICLWVYPSKHTKAWLCRYLKVRRVTKNVCKLPMKRVRLNKVAQHEKKYLLNCSVRIYQRIINWSIEQVGIYQCFLVINPCVFISVRQTYQTIVNFNWVQI